MSNKLAEIFASKEKQVASAMQQTPIATMMDLAHARPRADGTAHVDANRHEWQCHGVRGAKNRSSISFFAPCVARRRGGANHAVDSRIKKIIAIARGDKAGFFGD